MAPKTPEELRESNRIRKAAQRAREKTAAIAEAEREAKAEEAKISAKERLENHNRDLAWAQEFDETGRRYKSECRKLVDLLTIFEGTNPLDKDDDDEDQPKRKKKDDQVRPIPFSAKFKIRALEYQDDSFGPEAAITVKLEPDMFEYKKLNGEVIFPKTQYMENGVISFRRWLDLRDYYRKNLFALGRLLGKNLYHASHQMICDAFVQKNFDNMYFDDYDQDDVHRMIGKQQRFDENGQETRTLMLLAPRSGYKSTIDGLDSVQWMLNAPDIRIMIITAFRRLAKTFLKEIKSYFYLSKRANPSMFHLMFPEYVLYGKQGTSAEPITCPAKTLNSKEEHLWITSMESSATGLRCDIRKADDTVDPKNSNSEELRESLKQEIIGTNDLVEPWGMTDFIGTRYFTKDYYGVRMSPDEETKQAPAPFKYLCISSWSPKPGFERKYEALLKEQGGMYKVTEDMVDLWFPQKLSYSELRRRLLEKKGVDGERSFKNQQLNIATDPREIDQYVNQFDEDVLKSVLFSQRKAAMPKGAEFQETIQSWDIAYSETRTSDYSVGATLDVYKFKDGRYGVVVVEVFFDKWKASELPSNIFKYYQKHNPSKVYIENSNGVSFLKGHIENFAKLHGVDLFTSNKFIQRPVDVRPNAKRLRIKDLEFLLGNGMLQFIDGDWITETFKQLTAYTGAKSTVYRKDDIPDALSLGVVSHLPVTALQHNPDPKDVEKETEQRREKENREALKRRMFGTDSPVRQQQAPPPQPTAQPRAVPYPRGGNFATLPSAMTRRGNR